MLHSRASSLFASGNEIANSAADQPIDNLLEQSILGVNADGIENSEDAAANLNDSIILNLEPEDDNFLGFLTNHVEEENLAERHAQMGFSKTLKRLSMGQASSSNQGPTTTKFGAHKLNSSSSNGIDGPGGVQAESSENLEQSAFLGPLDDSSSDEENLHAAPDGHEDDDLLEE